MITSLGFKNFKIWQDFGPVRFAPLTVLFGANSSGKSSVAQFLLMLKQTTESQDKKMVFNIGSAKAAVDLGNYYEMVFEHNETSNVGFSFDWLLNQPLVLADRYNRIRYAGRLMHFEAEVGLLADKGSVLAVQRMSYQLGREVDTPLSPAVQRFMRVGMKRTEEDKAPYKLISENYNFVRNPGRVWPITAPVKCYGFPDEVVNYYQNADVVKALAFTFEKLFQGVFYLGPLRDKLMRQYTWTGEAPENVGWKGEQTIPSILAARDRILSAGTKKRQRPLIYIVAQWLQRMGLIEHFELKQIAPRRREYEVLVKTFGTKECVNITDVGFGVSQFLPVLVQCYYAPPGSVIIIEQPEIHLHPSAQSWLADLFIEVIHSREHGTSRGIQLIIESHSEHFLRRLQRRIAEEYLDANEVAAYYCEGSATGSKIRPLDVDQFGNIRNWPDRFFGDTMEDAVARTDAHMARLQSGGEQNG
jgi:predicted ATPase